MQFQNKERRLNCPRVPKPAALCTPAKPKPPPWSRPSRSLPWPLPFTAAGIIRCFLLLFLNVTCLPLVLILGLCTCLSPPARVFPETGPESWGQWRSAQCMEPSPACSVHRELSLLWPHLMDGLSLSEKQNLGPERDLKITSNIHKALTKCPMHLLFQVLSYINSLNPFCRQEN